MGNKKTVPKLSIVALIISIICAIWSMSLVMWTSEPIYSFLVDKSICPETVVVATHESGNDKYPLTLEEVSKPRTLRGLYYANKAREF